MTIRPAFLAISITLIHVSLLPPTVVYGLGTASTTAVAYGTTTVCGIVAAEPTQRIQCYQNGQIISVQPSISFETISGGGSFFCGLRSGGLSLLCWDTSSSNYSFKPKRIYNSDKVELTDLTVGDAQVCAREVNSGMVKCWRGSNDGSSKFPPHGEALRFRAITSGSGFSCGILKNNSRVLCWGNGYLGYEIQVQFANLSMSSLVAGESHACGLTTTGRLVCKGHNDSNQLNVPFSSAYQFSILALGADFTCAIRVRNGMVVCWGGKNGNEFESNAIENISFETIVAGLDFVCGLTTSNLSIICWGPGWSNLPSEIPLGRMIPGPCVQASCSTCGTYPDSEALCNGSGNICKSCEIELPVAVPVQPVASASPPIKARNKVSLAFVVVGSVGVFAGICTIIFCLWAALCGFLRMNVRNSVQPTSAEANADNAATMPHFGSSVPTSRSYSINRQASVTLRRQRSGSSISSKNADRTQTFTFSELSTATTNFSLENKIGAGSFGSVYKGKLADGREVAIKRAETSVKTKKFQEKEIAFDSELALLSRLHHKHLVGLVGFCEEKNERLLVYEHMSNGSLRDHLHDEKNVENTSSILNSWKMRIKIALDAARGIDYLHNYAVPPIIHRDIKSSNILLDANWTARVSDFGLSLILEPESEHEPTSIKAVGTVGYIDPEYYVLNVLTTKSDVYGFGVVLFELLTGKKAVFRNNQDNGASPMSVVEHAGPLILEGELQKVLDRRVGPPEMNESEAVQLVAYIATSCVNLEGKERPSMSDIVANLERALALCEDHDCNLSPTTWSIHSD
ncbi:hypothetical protein F2P56_032322 [Juglans regia]|uniref:non-specific serine/threonine protein kinase n=2 Tax=Juglans regia TaxID=51240 RepID=A0A2I4FUT1_JUGRE|nr:putative serine/threonine-protein kinase-like protein CCR3 [Juglans regia]KAF5446719.1 hypothetical protein F2P56_032322 [Juglans regia]